MSQDSRGRDEFSSKHATWGISAAAGKAKNYFVYAYHDGEIVVLYGDRAHIPTPTRQLVGNGTLFETCRINSLCWPMMIREYFSTTPSGRMTLCSIKGRSTGRLVLVEQEVCGGAPAATTAPARGLIAPLDGPKAWVHGAAVSDESYLPLMNTRALHLARSRIYAHLHEMTLRSTMAADGVGVR